MATVKITITLPVEQLDEIRKSVAADRASSVSGFIQRAVEQTLQNAVELSALLDESLEKTGGPLTAKERAWARKMLTPNKRRAKKSTPGRAA